MLYHLALIEADWLFVDVMEQPYPEELNALLPIDHRDLERHLSVAPEGETLDQHLHRLRRIRELLLEAFRSMPPGELHRERHLDEYDVSPAWVLFHLTQHEAEHRSEIVSIARAVGAGSSI